MTDNINPASKAAEVIPDSPFNCPHCKKPANQIEATPMGPLMVFWHPGCKSILALQLLGMPQSIQPRVIVPGRAM